MKREADSFGDVELELVYIAKKLKEALRLEEALTKAELDYAVEPDVYHGGVIFRTERVGAFFYVPPESTEAAEGVVVGLGLRPYREDEVS